MCHLWRHVPTKLKEGIQNQNFFLKKKELITLTISPVIFNKLKMEAKLVNNLSKQIGVERDTSHH